MRSSCHVIHQLRQIRTSLDHKTSVMLANALVTSKLDFCNSLFFGLPQSSIHRLQLVQNSLARAIFPSVKRRQHITPILRKLHWLPASQRISYKIALVTYKTLHGYGPRYLSDLHLRHKPARDLRLPDKHLLSIPAIKSSCGRRSFSFAAPSLWNSLPQALRSSTSLTSFRSALKTHLFPP